MPMSNLPGLHSKEYEEFLRGEAEQRKLNLYEVACNAASKILPIQPWKDLNDQYLDAIGFSHLKVTPQGAYALMLLATIFAAISTAALILIFSEISLATVLLVGVAGFVVFYFLYDYPMHYAIIFRIRASSEMVLAIIYMTISMRISSNIENAIEFAANNLTGSLRVDLQQLLWDIYMRKYDSAAAGLDFFIDKWKRENSEFAEAIYTLKTAVIESTSRREKVLDEAVNIMLEGTSDRMKHYAQELRSPMTILNALGILLPIIGLVFLPMIAVFMPNSVQPGVIIVGYNIILPLLVYWITKTYLEKRPYSFHQPDISQHKSFKVEKPWHYPLIGFLAGIPFVAFGAYKIITLDGPFSFEQLAYSILVSAGLALGIATYSILSVYKKLKLREEVYQMESEFADALFQLGSQITRGIPIETTLQRITPQIKNMRISKLFEVILYNIETFGMTLEQAVFDEKSGAINEYPSKLIRAVMHAVVQISKRGMDTASQAMITISTYLKDSNKVEEMMKEDMSEVTGTMQLQALLLAPLSSGIVVALASMMMDMLLMLKGKMEDIYNVTGSPGAVGAATGGIFTSILNVKSMIPVSVFQLIVSVYMLEVVAMISLFLSVIENGEESLLKRYSLGKTLLLAIAIYAIVLIVCYTMFSSLIPLSGMKT
jgi:hypothetical protein